MIAIEKENGSLKNALNKNYGRPNLSNRVLGDLIDIFSSIGIGDKETKSRDVLRREYEYFLQKFVSAEGKGGGEFYTLHSIVNLLVEMLQPYEGRVYERIIQILIQLNESKRCYAKGYAYVRGQNELVIFMNFFVFY